MRKIIKLYVVLALASVFGATTILAIEEPKMPEPITVTGFDSEGEPEIRPGENGSIEIMFNFMPPLNGSTDQNPSPIFDTFEKVLEAELGVMVQRDDRELFIIPKPNPDTAHRVKEFLENFWSKTWPKLQASKP